jgi:anti-anti-sigma factor
MANLQVLECEDGTLDVIGEIDAHSVASLSEMLASRQQGHVGLRLDKCTFMDSSGLRVLLAAHEECVERDARLVLLEPDSVVMRLLEVAGLRDHFHIDE